MFTMEGGAISGNTADSSQGGGGGVYISGGMFTMEGGEIRGNTATKGGGVSVDDGSAFTMSGGTISGNAASSGGGGVYFAPYYNSASFIKSGGTIYGSDASVELKNTAGNGDSGGHAAYCDDGSRKRNTTAGPGVNLDSSKDGAAGGWE
jgi:hypothetical protein